MARHTSSTGRRTIPALLLLVLALFSPRLPAAHPAALPGGPLAPAEEATPDATLATPPAAACRERGQVLAQLGVDRWHRLGYRGRGVKIAVLDSGFRGYRAHLGKCLPARVTVRSFRSDGDLEARDSQHGILCAEVLHAIAPDAELLFANWDTDRPDEFLAAVRWARRQGARVISCSLIMPTWSDGEGGGPVHAALARLLGRGEGPGDVLYFASAGNTAQRHWSGRFREGKEGLHEWEPGRVENRIFPWCTGCVSVEMCWKADARYELMVRATATGRLVGRAVSRGDPRGPAHRCAVVRFLPNSWETYEVEVRQLRGRPGPFHLVVLGGGLEYSRARGSIGFPGDGPEVLAVGAVDGEGRRISYSSCGPNSDRPKPDFVAPVPFPSSWRARPFTGTSAAAPQAAGLAALLWSRHPGWSAARVRDALRAAARDLGPVGPDTETGYGLVHLP